MNQNKEKSIIETMISIISGGMHVYKCVGFCTITKKSFFTIKKVDRLIEDPNFKYVIAANQEEAAKKYLRVNSMNQDIIDYNNKKIDQVYFDIKEVSIFDIDEEVVKSMNMEDLVTLKSWADKLVSEYKRLSKTMKALK